MEQTKAEIELRKITDANIWRVVELSVTKAQEDFVATNTQSLLEAYLTLAEGHAVLPFALYAGETLVGFIMFGYDTPDGPDDPLIAQKNYCLWRLMIDAAHQGRGYGRAALRAALDYLAGFPCGKADCCWLSYEPENVRAKALYASFGFVENGELCGGEIVAVRPLP